MSSCHRPIRTLPRAVPCCVCCSLHLGSGLVSGSGTNRLAVGHAKDKRAGIPLGLLCVSYFCLVAILVPVLGCGGESDQSSVAVALEDPVGEFEWGMTRLERALRIFRPSSGGGLNVTGREVVHELIPPSDNQPNYTALVTVTTKSSYLHAKRSIKKDMKSGATQKETEMDDLLADNTGELSKFIDVPGAGPQVASVPATKIEPRRLESQVVFEMVYLQGHWKLAAKPEEKHAQLWFEYAFD